MGTRFFFLLLSCCLVPALHAQDFGGGRLIPSGSAPSSAAPSSNAGSSLNWKPAQKEETRLAPPSNPSINMSGEKPDYVNRYTVQPNATSKPTGASAVVSKDGIKELGQIRTHLDTLVVRYRDWLDVDGDVVKIKCNGVIVARHSALEAGYASVRIVLREGINMVEFKAMSSGEGGGATAEYEITDLNGNPLLQTDWDLEELQTGLLKIEKY